MVWMSISSKRKETVLTVLFHLRSLFIKRGKKPYNTLSHHPSFPTGIFPYHDMQISQKISSNSMIKMNPPRRQSRLLSLTIPSLQPINPSQPILMLNRLRTIRTAPGRFLNINNLPRSRLLKRSVLLVLMMIIPR